MAHGRTDDQRTIDFASAEASKAERWNALTLALSRIGTRCDLYLKDFVQWVYRATGDGTHGELARSYAQLGERPLGLCCSVRKVQMTVDRAERLGLIAVRRHVTLAGAPQPNGYSIDWPGISQILRGRASHERGPYGTTCTTYGTTCQTYSTSCTTPSLHGARARESFLEARTVTGPGTEPNPSDLVSVRTDGPRVAVRDDVRACPRVARPRTDAAERLGADADTLTATLLGQSPILAAATRRIAPLPAGSLDHGAFAPLTERHLYRPLTLVHWHRRQLSTAAPVMGDREADLLLTLATAFWATSLGEAAIRRNRTAAFVSTIVRRQWLHSIGFVPRARKLLDAAIARLGADWAGL